MLLDPQVNVAVQAPFVDPLDSRMSLSQPGENDGKAQAQAQAQALVHDPFFMMFFENSTKICLFIVLDVCMRFVIAY